MEIEADRWQQAGADAASLQPAPGRNYMAKKKIQRKSLRSLARKKSVRKKFTRKIVKKARRAIRRARKAR
jgi:hypothetical protein